MKKRRIVFASVAALLVVAVASVLPPYSSLWDALKQRHLEPSGQARWQVRERERRADEERRQKLAEEERLAAEARAAEEQKERAARELEAKKAEWTEARNQMATVARELSVLAAKAETIATSAQGRGAAAFAQMQWIERSLDGYFDTTARQVDLPIARIMSGDACRRSYGPSSLFDDAVDTNRYLVLCAYQYAHQDGDLFTRAGLILFLNRTGDYNLSHLTEQRIRVADLMRYLWIEHLKATGDSVYLSDKPMDAVRGLFESKAPSFARTAILDSLSVSELDALRSLVSDLRSYQELRNELRSACRRYSSAEESAARLEAEAKLVVGDKPQASAKMEFWKFASTSSPGDPAEYDWQARVSAVARSAGTPEQFCRPE